MAIGPTLGGRIIHHTGDLLSVFYFATAVHVLTGTIWMIFVPESLPSDVRAANIAKYRGDRLEQAELRAQGGESCRRFNWRSMFGFLEPLSLLLPRARDPLRPEKGKDWNLTFLVCAHGCALTLMVRGPPPRPVSSFICLPGFIPVQVPICGRGFQVDNRTCKPGYAQHPQAS